MVKCSNCGADVGDSKFCPNCGTEVVGEHKASFCSNCGADVGDSKFCPNCGTAVEKETQKAFCPNCGAEKTGSAFCPQCGYKFGDNPSNNASQNNAGSSDSTLDRIIGVDEKVSGKFGKILGKSKAMDAVYGASANIRRNIGMDEKYVQFYARNEPAFLEVYDALEDDFVKSILAIEREKLGSVGGGTVGAVMSAVHIPTKDMSHDEAIQFYINLVNKIKGEISAQKQKGTFSEDEFYKQKVKESQLENLSIVAPLKAFRAFKK